MRRRGKGESNMSNRWSRLCSITYAIGFSALTLHAQSQPAPVTCLTAPPATQSFSVERTVMPSNTGTTFDTNLSSTILASLALGTLEMREQLVYSPQTNTLTSTVFLVQPGSPIPTPTDVDITSMTLATYSISVDGAFPSSGRVPIFL